jgi:hypothetical protein
MIYPCLKWRARALQAGRVDLRYDLSDSVQCVLYAQLPYTLMVSMPWLQYLEQFYAGARSLTHKELFHRSHGINCPQSHTP